MIAAKGGVDMAWLDRLREIKSNLNLSTKEIASVSGIPEPTLEKLFSGQTKNPGINSIQKLVHALGYTLDDLDDSPQIKNAPSFLSEEAKRIAKAFDSLDYHGKKIINTVLEEESHRMREEDAAKAAQREDQVIDMMVFNNPSAAGIPMYADSDYERLEFLKSEVQPGADFGVRISGDSMEPTIPDGAIVWVRAVPEIVDGHIGIFMIDDRSVCKRMRHDGQHIYLDSDNTKYDPIAIGEFDRLGVVGQVLGYK